MTSRKTKTTPAKTLVLIRHLEWLLQDLSCA